MPIRIIKKDEITALLVPYQVQDKSYLCVSMLLGFDLLAPEKTVNEQKMWQSINASLAGRLFDVGMPKLQPEWLLSGACFSGKTPRSMVKVSVQLAGCEKQIDVYGQRHWQMQLGQLVPSSPLPFTRQPLIWELSWGGEEINENTLGLSKKEASYPLPCLFYSPDSHSQLDDIIYSTPVCFLPLAIDHPVRQACMGTYDEIWFRERWPAVPKDFDWHFYNQAPLDQRLNTFFTGGEPYHLVNLHPSQAVITGQLPVYRPRVFVRQYADLNQAKEQSSCLSVKEGELNKALRYQTTELGLRNDTVWFFPEQALGVRIFRGSIEIQDEEALDVADILLVSEDISQAQRPSDYYVDYITHYNPAKEAETAEMAQLAEKTQQAKISLAAAEKELSDIPQYLSFKQAQFNNKVPAAKPQLNEGIAQLDRALNAAHGQFGEMAKSHAGIAPKMQTLLAQSHQKIDDMQASMAQQMQMQMKLQHEQQQELSNIKLKKPNIANHPEYNQQILEMENKLNAQNIMLDSAQSKAPWHDRASEFVAQHTDFNHLSNRRKQLLGYGFRNLNIQRLMLGYVAHETVFLPQQWGLSADDILDDGPLILPVGWVLPEYRDGLFTALNIRSSLFEPETNTLVYGSQSQPWYGSLTPGLPLIICQDRSFAWLIEQDIRSVANVIEMPSLDAELNESVADAIKAAPELFLYVQNIEDITPWEALFPGIKPIRLKGEILIEEAYAQAIDLFSWFVEQLAPDEGMTSTEFLTQQEKQKRKALFQVPAFNTEQAQLAFDQKQAGMAKSFGLSPDTDLKGSLHQVFDQKAQSLRAKLPSEQVARVFDSGLEKLKAAPATNSSASELLTQLSEQSQALLMQEQNKIQSPQAKEIALKQLDLIKKESQEASDNLKALEAIPLPETNNEEGQAEFDKLTREQVIDRQAQGLSLAKKDLSGLDLSGLDLSGADLTESLLSETDLSGAQLVSATLVAVVATESVWNKVNASGANLNRALLSESVANEAIFTHASFNEAVMSQSEFNGSDFAHADLTKVTACESQFNGAQFNDCQLFQANLLQTQLEGAQFIDCQALQIKCFEARAENSVWRGSVLDKALFWSATLTQADFCGAQLTNARFGNAQLEGARFNDAVLVKSNFADSNVTGGRFHRTNMENVYMSNANMQRTEFFGVNLKRAQCLRSNFNGSHFHAVNGMQTNFMRSSFVNSQLDRVCFYNGDLYKTTFGQTRIKGCNFKATLLENNEDLIYG